MVTSNDSNTSPLVSSRSAPALREARHRRSRSNADQNCSAVAVYPGQAHLPDAFYKPITDIPFQLAVRAHIVIAVDKNGSVPSQPAQIPGIISVLGKPVQAYGQPLVDFTTDTKTSNPASAHINLIAPHALVFDTGDTAGADDDEMRILLLELVNLSPAAIRTFKGPQRLAWASRRLQRELNEHRLQLFAYPKAKRWRRAESSPVTSGAYVERLVLRRPQLPGEVEVGKLTFNEMVALLPSSRPKHKLAASTNELQEGSLWSRQPGQKCQIPNKPLHHIGGQGCTAIAYSPDGLIMAVAHVDMHDRGVVKLYSVLNIDALCLAELRGHQDAVTGVAWTARGTQCYLLTASRDGSVRAWDVPDLDTEPPYCWGVFQHAEAVTCCRALAGPSPDTPCMATGSVTGSVRIWRLDPDAISAVSPRHAYSPTQVRRGRVAPPTFVRPQSTLLGHAARITDLCVQADGKRVYSGDAVGVVRVWSCASSAHGKWECIKAISDVGGEPIVSLQIAVNERSMLMQSASQLRQVDLRVFRVFSDFACPTPELLKSKGIRSRLVWSVETGYISAVYEYDQASGIAHCQQIVCHPHEHMTAFVSETSGGISVFKWDKTWQAMNVEPFAVTSAAATTRTQEVLLQIESKFKANVNVSTAALAADARSQRSSAGPLLGAGSRSMAVLNRSRSRAASSTLLGMPTSYSIDADTKATTGDGNGGGRSTTRLTGGQTSAFRRSQGDVPQGVRRRRSQANMLSASPNVPSPTATASEPADQGDNANPHQTRLDELHRRKTAAMAERRRLSLTIQQEVGEAATFADATDDQSRVVAPPTGDGKALPRLRIQT
ncbi:Jouberin [Sorochytrium milnesiophthora]